MKFWASIIMILVITNGCSLFGRRGPASTDHDLKFPAVAELQDAIAFVHQEIDKIDADNCEGNLYGLYEWALKGKGEQFLPRTEGERDRLYKKSMGTVYGLFEMRRKLQKKLGEFIKEKQSEKEMEYCASRIRSFIRAARWTEEYLGEWYLWRRAGVNPAVNPKDRHLQKFGGWVQVTDDYTSDRRGLPPRDKVKPKVKLSTTVLADYDRKKPNLLLSHGLRKQMENPVHENQVPLKSGDVLLSRGGAFASAAIARIGDEDGQFSHLAIAYVEEGHESDPAPKRNKHTWIIEAHMDGGVMVVPYKDYQNDGKVRAVLYRYKDPQCAARAGKFAFDDAIKKFNERNSSKGTWAELRPRLYTDKNYLDYKWRKYDYPMIIGFREDPPEVWEQKSEDQFCSEVVSVAYYKACHRTVLPTYPTTFDELLVNPDTGEIKNGFMKALGVNVRKTFAPSDIEVDQRFEMVADWRDFSHMEESRQLDAILTKIFEWMHRENYDLNLQGESIVSRWTNIIFGAPILSRVVKSQLPEGLDERPDFIKASAVMWKLTKKKLLPDIQVEDMKKRATTGLPMSYEDMRDTLEKWRFEDYKVWACDELGLKDTAGIPIIGWGDRKIRRQGWQFHELIHPPVPEELPRGFCK